MDRNSFGIYFRNDYIKGQKALNTYDNEYNNNNTTENQFNEMFKENAFEETNSNTAMYCGDLVDTGFGNYGQQVCQFNGFGSIPLYSPEMSMNYTYPMDQQPVEQRDYAEFITNSVINYNQNFTTSFESQSQETILRYQMNQSNSLLLTPESTVPEETSHYDYNNLDDIAKTKQMVKEKKDTKTTKSALEKQSQKLKRTHLTAQMIYLLCQRGYKFVMRKRQKKSTKPKH